MRFSKIAQTISITGCREDPLASDVIVWFNQEVAQMTIHNTMKSDFHTDAPPVSVGAL